MELLFVVWAFGHFRTNINGVHSQRLCVQKTLASVMKGNRGNRMFFICQTTWRDRFLLFQRDVCHLLAWMLGFADHLSRHPSAVQGKLINAEEVSETWITEKHGTAVDSISDKELDQPIKQKHGHFEYTTKHENVDSIKAAIGLSDEQSALHVISTKHDKPRDTDSLIEEIVFIEYR